MLKKIKIEQYHYIALVGWIAKIFTVIFSLINTRMLLDIIGIEGFAVYTIIFSLLGWLSLLNFSIPSAVQNTISKFTIEKKDIKILLQTILFMIIVIILLSVPLLIILSKIVYQTLLIDYQNLIETEYLFVMLFLLVVFGLSEIFNKILFSLHKGHLANIYPAIISVLSFVGLLFVENRNLSDVNIVLIIFFVPYLFIFIVSYIQAVGFIRPNFDKNIFKIVIKLMKKFFLFAILAAFVLKVDYIIMSQVLEASDIAIYNLDMRVFNLILFMYGTILAALWPVSAEMFHKKEYNSILKNIRKNIFYGIAISMLLGVFIIYFKDNIFLLLSGKTHLTVSFSTVFLTLLYIIIRIWTDSFATILQSMNEINILIYIVPAQALISILGQYYLGQYYGLNGIILGLILSFLLTVVWLLPLKFHKLIKAHNNE